uniref:Uncharacterized protein n=1 Tax=Oryza sativa TaxID=4530 RepID=Q949G0_ORYSA|nr:putative protein [Oryza sativa]
MTVVAARRGREREGAPAARRWHGKGGTTWWWMRRCSTVRSVVVAVWLDGELGQSSTGRRSPSGSGGRMGMEPKLGPSGGAGGWGRGPSGNDGEGGAREASEERIRSLQPAGSASSPLTARYCSPACLPLLLPSRPRVAAAVRR